MAARNLAGYDDGRFRSAADHHLHHHRCSVYKSDNVYEVEPKIVCGQKMKGNDDNDDEDDDGATTTTTTKAVTVIRYRWWLPGNERAAHKTRNESIKSPRPVGGD